MERRSSQARSAEPHGEEGPGVGGRHSRRPHGPGGGGDLGTCNFSKFPPEPGDPRLDDLRAIGLQPCWRRIAALIGCDLWDKVWRLLDEDATRGNDGAMYIPLRSYRSYLRYQRNQLVRTLYAGGMRINDVQDEVHKAVGERLSRKHLYRIIGSR